MALMKTRRGALAATVAGNALYPLLSQGALTLSAGVITDVTRLAGVEGDGATYPASRAGVWPAVTNLFSGKGRNSNSGANLTCTPDSTEYPIFGGVSDKCVSAGAGTGEGVAVYPSADVSAATTYTWSVFGVFPVGATLKLRCTERNAGDAAIGDVGYANFVGTGALQRVTFSGATTTGVKSRAVVETITTPQAITWYVAGWQLEPGSVATPFAVTSRVAGRIQMPASVLDETQMWIAGRLRAGQAYNAGSGAIRVWQWQDSGTERLILQYVLGDKFYWDRDTGAGGAYVSSTLNFASGDGISFAAYATASALGISINGATFTTGANTAVPTLAASLADIASNAGGNQWNGDVAWFAAGKGTLTNADAALFNSWGNNDPLPHQFPRSAQLTFLARFNGDGTAYRYSA